MDSVSNKPPDDADAALSEVTALLMRETNAPWRRDAAFLEHRRLLGERRDALVADAERRRAEAALERDRQTAAPLSEADEDNAGDCPLCLDPLPMEPSLTVRMTCCGKLMCAECKTMREKNQAEVVNKMMPQIVSEVASDLIAERRDHIEPREMSSRVMNSKAVGSSYQCILCRDIGPSDDADRMKNYEKHALRGRAWAQFALSEELLEEPGSTARAVELLRKSASQGYHLAEDKLGRCYMHGYEGIEQSEDEARRWFQRAARKGSPIGQHSLAHSLERDDDDEYFRLLTLSAAQGFVPAQESLAECHLHARGTEYDAARCVYWLKKAAKRNGTSRAQCLLGVMLVGRAEELYGKADIPGYSPIPTAMRLVRRALEVDEPFEHAEGALQKMMADYCTACANCKQSPRESESLFWCSSCRSALFCSKTCQRSHWRAGHTADCCDSTSTD